MLNYETDGRGAPLLLIHGFGISFNIWQNLRPLLRDHFTLIMVELPGIGSSPEPSPHLDYLASAVEGLEQVRSALEIDRWHVLSYSTGARVGERYVLENADRVARAVFLCAACTDVWKARAAGFALGLDSYTPWLGDWALSGWRLKGLINIFGFSLKPSPYLHAWTNEVGSQSVRILKATLRSLPENGAAPIPPMSVPALIVRGTQDWITVPPRHPAEQDRLIRAAHSAPVTDAAQVADVVLPFLLQN
ncbi:MAG TPA: alpha/beta hydrolase [Anaerolineales bacterium]|jgi:pimeloyl-ACP methyl ester carboxylesterase